MKNMYIIKWGNDFYDNYNYGSAISFDPNGSVHYSSPFMPPGTVIKAWHSKTAFHESRKSPLLPILKSGRRYRLKMEAEFDHPHAAQIMIEFFDENDFLLNKITLQSKTNEFLFPREAVHYTISLTNNIHKQIVFHSIQITESKLEKHFNFISLEVDGAIYLSLKHKYRQKDTPTKVVLQHSRKYTNHLSVGMQANYLFLLLDPQLITEPTDFLTSIYQNLLDLKFPTGPFEIEKGKYFHTLPDTHQLIANALDILLPIRKSSEKKIQLSSDLSTTNNSKAQSFALKVIDQYITTQKQAVQKRPALKN